VTFGSLGFGLASFLHEESITLLLLLNTITASLFAALLRHAFRGATETPSFATFLDDFAVTVLLLNLQTGASGFLAFFPCLAFWCTTLARSLAAFQFFFFSPARIRALPSDFLAFLHLLTFSFITRISFFPC